MEIIDASGFYKMEDGELLHAINSVGIWSYQGGAWVKL